MWPRFQFPDLTSCGLSLLLFVLVNFLKILKCLLLETIINVEQVFIIISLIYKCPRFVHIFSLAGC